jgi:hypothetical protein
MGDIYLHSILNIASAGFADGSNGLFAKRNHKILEPIYITLENDQYVRTSKDKRHIEAHSGNYVLVDVLAWRDGVDEAPLGKRGWVVQERSLSVRTLHFGAEQLFWECLSQEASEVCPDGFVAGTFGRTPKSLLKTREEDPKAVRATGPGAYQSTLEFLEIMRQMSNNPIRHDSEDSDSDDSDYLAPPPPERPTVSAEEIGLREAFLAGMNLNVCDDLPITGLEELKADILMLRAEHIDLDKSDEFDFDPLPQRGMTEAQKKWRSLVETYSGCRLTFSTDKLVAISGLASRIGRDMQCEYLAGMWRRDLEHQLLWKVVKPEKAVVADGTRGPSWSWASVDSAVRLDGWAGYYYLG